MRRYQLDYYHSRRADDLIFREAQADRSRQRYRDLTAAERREVNRLKREGELANHGQAALNARARAGHAARMLDPEQAAAHAARQQRWRDANADRWRALQRAAAARKRRRDAEVELGRVAHELTRRDADAADDD